MASGEREKDEGDDRVSAAFTQADCTSTITGCHKIAGGVTSGAVNVPHFGVLQSLCRGGLGINAARRTAGSQRIPRPMGMKACRLWRALMQIPYDKLSHFAFFPSAVPFQTYLRQIESVDAPSRYISLRYQIYSHCPVS